MEYNKVLVHTYPSSSVVLSRSEILRYMSCAGETEDVRNLIDEFLPRVTDAIRCRGSFVYLPLYYDNGGVTLGDVPVLSLSLAKHLSHCKGAVVFSLSCGMELDRLIGKYSRIRPSAALCINAIATTAIESYADVFCKEIELCFKNEGLHITQRFSPGYGDLSLDFQPVFLKLTNASVLCGINLSDSLIMTPSKSITALVGVSRYAGACRENKCNNCNKLNCQYSKR